MTFRIRPATVADLPAVQAVLRETWHDTYDPIFGAATVADMTARWHALPGLEQECRSPDRALLVALDGDQLVATASVRRRAPPRARLDRLYVRPAFQHRGHGRALLLAAAAAVEDREVIEADVHPRNAKALAFYARMGFEHDTTSDADPSGEESVLLVWRRP